MQRTGDEEVAQYTAGRSTKDVSICPPLKHDCNFLANILRGTMSNSLASLDKLHLSMSVSDCRFAYLCFSNICMYLTVGLSFICF